jgi:hypothetical protein
MIWLELLTRAARMAGLLKRPGVGLNGSEQGECALIANAHLDGLKAERLFVYAVDRITVSTIIGQQDYIVGSLANKANWVAPFFEKLLGAGFLVPGSTPNIPSEIPMENILSFTQWKNIITKGVTSSQPRVIYYRPTLGTNTDPVGTASLWPVPQDVSQVVLYAPLQVQEIGDITDTVVMPQAHREGLMYSLAVAINDGYPNLIMKPNVAAKALEWKARIKANQFTPTFLRSDGAALATQDATRYGWWGAREWPGGYT